MQSKGIPLLLLLTLLLGLVGAIFQVRYSRAWAKPNVYPEPWHVIIYAIMLVPLVFLISELTQ